eukprot:6283029-Prymnesium_polylepis.1
MIFRQPFTSQRLSAHTYIPLARYRIVSYVCLTSRSCMGVQETPSQRQPPRKRAEPHTHPTRHRCECLGRRR